jgi:hypothetical protein
MLFLRIFGKLLLFIAFLALAYDGARILATPGEGLLLTSIATHLRTHIPQAQENLAQFFLAYAPAYVWNGIIEPLLVLPVSLLFGIAGTLIFLTGYRRPPPEIPAD